MGAGKRQSIWQKSALWFCAVVLASTGFALPARAAMPVEVGMATGNTLLFVSDDALEARLRSIRKMDITLLRVDFNWSLIQKNGYDYWDWRYHDRVVTAAARHGMKVMALLTYTPAWARNLKCLEVVPDEAGRQKCSPRDTLEYARFARTVAERYAPQGVYAYEIWNEPNHKGFWKWVGPSGQLDLNPETYGRLLNTAAKAIHEADPNAVVISGGLSPAYSKNDPQAMRQSDYLRRLLPEVEPHGVVNAVGIHPYTWPATPREFRDWNAFWTVDHGTPEYNLRTVMQEVGHSDMMIWATEFGASTVGVLDMCSSVEDRKIPGKIFDHVSEDLQADIIGQGIEDWFAKENVGPLFFHADSDQFLGSYSNEGGYGLRRANGTEKPAYGRFLDSLARARQEAHE